ncbi:hypothetical protein FALBO_928 [Fusarium albosuccineum]|uniref:Uncharacterized protein n=1 Tax=Fusarium albosuccineum TaxID=1237068 RepID=A0A8H4LML6_9HYPO|nr:hypothetical protein FALBO_928 [Fusarium albosuccineum]
MFCRIGVESSSFMDEHCLSGVSQWYSHNSPEDSTSCPQFNNLDEALYELRRLDLRYSNKPWDVGADDAFEASQNIEEEAPGLALQEGLREWNQRFKSFEASCQLRDHSDDSISQLQNLRLRRLFWQMTIDAFASEEARSDADLFVPFMTVAESVAAPLIATGQPTFSLDGDLISGLSFVVSVTADDEIKLRALDLLRQLNRREGIWDSNDIVEMHELSVTFSESHGAVMETNNKCETEIHAGLPGIIQELRGKVPAS